MLEVVSVVSVNIFKGYKYNFFEKRFTMLINNKSTVFTEISKVNIMCFYLDSPYPLAALLAHQFTTMTKLIEPVVAVPQVLDSDWVLALSPILL